MEICKLKALTSLDLRDNRLSSLLAEIGNFTSLTWLDLRENRLTSLPPEIGKLKALTSLNLSSNQISSLPPEIGKLTSLTELVFGGNQLRNLPAEIVKLTSLTSLTLWSNQISSLPPEIGKLTSLVGLTLSTNQLSSLPAEIGKLRLLRHLDLRDNQLSRLPLAILRLHNLCNLELNGNPGLGLSDELIDLGKSDGYYGGKRVRTLLESYFSTQLREKGFWERERSRLETCYPSQRVAKRLLEGRILVLGDGAVGKTSLVRRLIHDESARPAEGKTAGIEIAKWQRQVEGGETLTMHVWDFGGQGEMHAAHPYFFGQRTLYLLVVEGRQDHLVRERLNYWLDMIQSHAGKDARVILVQNKADQHLAPLDEHEWRARHPGLMAQGAFHAVSCTTGSGIEELRAAIREHVAAMPSIWEQWPAAWMDVKNTVAQRLTPAQPTLSLEEYIRLCAAAEVVEDEEQMTLLKALHDLGLVVAYPEDARLLPLGVQDPAWVRAGVYALLNHPALMAQQGLLAEADLGTLLADVPGYRAHHRLGLLELMVKFELAFRSAEGWIIPGLLNPTAVPAARSAPFTRQEQPLRFEFHYEMLPETLITRFIARQHGIAAGKGSGSWWRHGMILDCAGCPALVQAEVGRNGKISLVVAGPPNRRRDAMTVLRHAIDELHTAPQREMLQCKVPLPDHPEVAVDYEELMLLEAKGEKTNSARHRGKMIPYLVSELLDGVGRPARGDVFINQFHGDGATFVAGGVSGGLVGGLLNGLVEDRPTAVADGS